MKKEHTNFSKNGKCYRYLVVLNPVNTMMEELSGFIFKTRDEASDFSQKIDSDDCLSFNTTGIYAFQNTNCTREFKPVHDSKWYYANVLTDLDSPEEEDFLGCQIFSSYVESQEYLYTVAMKHYDYVRTIAFRTGEDIYCWTFNGQHWL